MDVFPLGLDVNWQQAQSVSIGDHYLRNWLLDTGSLTERIQSLCSSFEVERLGQSLANLHQQEILALQDNKGEYVVREVMLKADHKAWVFARSVIPLSLINGEWQSLGQQPLGKLLFNDQRFERGAFEVASIPSQHFASLGLSATEFDLLGRRSLFTLDELRVLVAEVFLPAGPMYKNFKL